MRWLLWPGALLSFVLSVHFAQRVDALRPRGARAHVLYIPSSSYLKHTSLGFQSLVADSLYLWGIQYSMDRRLKGQMTNLPRLFDVVTDLDPGFDDAYISGAFLIATDGQSVPKALELLDKGFGVRKSYRFPYDAGFYCYLYAKDYEKAEHYFRRAAESEGCPVYVRRLALRMGALHDPRAFYDAYREEMQSFQASHSSEEIESDVQNLRHLKLVRNKIRELEISLETEELERIMGGVGSALDLEALRQGAAAAGLAPVPLERGNDPWLDPWGEPYVIQEGKLVSATDVRVRGDS